MVLSYYIEDDERVETAKLERVQYIQEASAKRKDLWIAEKK